MSAGVLSGSQTTFKKPGRCCGARLGRARCRFSGITAGEFCTRWCEAFPHFVLLSCTEAPCWNVSAESTQQDSTCPGRCLASLHNFVLPYGNSVICSQERKWFPFVLMTPIFSSREQRTARDLRYKAELVLLQVSWHAIMMIKVLKLIWHWNKLNPIAPGMKIPLLILSLSKASSLQALPNELLSLGH